MLTVTRGASSLLMQRGRASGGDEPAKKPHGNTANDSPATVYKKYDKAGNYQKAGLSQNPDKRYTKAQVGGGRLDKLETGPRKEMLKKERDIVEKNPGPDNHEPWAGKRKDEK